MFLALESSKKVNNLVMMLDRSRIWRSKLFALSQFPHKLIRVVFLIFKSRQLRFFAGALKESVIIIKTIRDNEARLTIEDNQSELTYTLTPFRQPEFPCIQSSIVKTYTCAQTEPVDLNKSYPLHEITIAIRQCKFWKQLIFPKTYLPQRVFSDE